MCYVIVTCRSMLWTLLSIIVCIMHIYALMAPQWLIGSEDVIQPGVTAPSGRNDTTTTVQYKNMETFTPTMGVLTRCKQIYTQYRENNYVLCSYYPSFWELPSGLWQTMIVFYVVGLFILSIIALLSILSLCVRSICKKSLFTLSGFIQAVAGLLILIGLVFYAAGWGAPPVEKLCGETAAPFQPGDCAMGWSFYVSVAATVLTFACSVLSVQAEFATSVDDIQDEINKGKHLICIL